GSSAFRPNWPKFKVKPAFACPWMRPLWALRNLVRLGESMTFSQFSGGATTFPMLAAVATLAAAPGWLAFRKLLVLRHRVVFEDLTLEDPHLDATRTIGRMRGRHAEIDIGAQGMQRHPALPILFLARDFGATEAARATDADAFGAKPH